MKRLYYTSVCFWHNDSTRQRNRGGEIVSLVE